MNITQNRGSLTIETEGQLTFDKLKEILETIHVFGVPEDAVLTYWTVTIAPFAGPHSSFTINWETPRKD